MRKLNLQRERDCVYQSTTCRILGANSSTYKVQIDMTKQIEKQSGSEFTLQTNRIRSANSQYLVGSERNPSFLSQIRNIRRLETILGHVKSRVRLQCFRKSAFCEAEELRISSKKHTCPAHPAQMEYSSLNERIARNGAQYCLFGVWIFTFGLQSPIE